MTREQLLSAMLEDSLLHAKKSLASNYPVFLSDSFEDPIAFAKRIRKEIDQVSSDLPIREALARYLSREIAPVLARLSADFFNQSKKKRVEVLTEEISAADSALGRLMLEELSRGSYQGLTSELTSLSRTFVLAPLVLIQSVIPLATETQKIEETLSEKFPFSVITFQTVPSLGGGLRIFADGVLIDGSWLGRLRTILTTIHEQSYVI